MSYNFIIKSLGVSMNILFFPLGYLSFIDNFYTQYKSIFNNFKQELFDNGLYSDVTELYMWEKESSPISSDTLFDEERYFLKKDDRVYDVIFECDVNNRTNPLFFDICKKYFSLINFNSYIYENFDGKQFLIDDDTLEEILI
jgi:hypothetical protein